MKKTSSTVKNATTKKTSAKKKVESTEYSPSSVHVTASERPWYYLYLPFHFTELLISTARFHFWKTLIILSLPLSILGSIGAVTALYPFTQNYRQIAREAVQKVYPAELIVTAENGVVSTNVEEPYAIPISSLFGEEELENSTYSDISQVELENALVIDTAGSTDDFLDYQTFALLTDDTLVMYEGENLSEIRVIPLDTSINGVLSQDVLLDGIDYIDQNYPIKGILLSLLFIIPLFLLISMYSLTLLILILQTFFVWIISKMASQHIKFTRLMKYTLAVGAIWIFIYRIITQLQILAGAPITGLRLDFVVHMVICTLAYIGFKIKSNNQEFSFTQIILRVLLLPYFLANDLYLSQRSTEKKILLGILLILFFIIPWISFYLNTPSRILGAL